MEKEKVGKTLLWKDIVMRAMTRSSVDIECNVIFQEMIKTFDEDDRKAIFLLTEDFYKSWAHCRPALNKNAPVDVRLVFKD